MNLFYIISFLLSANRLLKNNSIENVDNKIMKIDLMDILGTLHLASEPLQVHMKH